MKLAAAAAVAALAGCATLVSRGPDQVPLASMPSGADVVINGKAAGKTPVVITLDRSGPAIVQVSLDGYQSVTLAMSTSFNYWVLGNIILFPLALVDVIDGNWQEFDDTPILVQLHPGAAT